MYRLLCRLCMLLLTLAIASFRATAQQNPADFPRATGVLELTETDKQRILQNFDVWTPPPELTRAPLPERVVNTAYLPKVGSQGTLGICGSYAIYYYLYSYYHAKALGLSERPAPDSSPQHIFSPAWGVLMAAHGYEKDVENLWHPWGANPALALESICRIGSLTWADMPYSDDANIPSADKFYRQLPSEAQMKAALFNKARRSLRINGINSQERLDYLKLFLAQGNIAVTVWNAPLTTNFDRYPAATEYVTVDEVKIGNVNNNVYAWPSIASGRPDGHAVTIVGYDDKITYQNNAGEQSEGALLIVNSWGTDWGISPAPGVERGFMWVGYDVVLNTGKFGSDAYAIVPRDELYQPRLLGIFQMQETDLEPMPGYYYPVSWPSLLTATVNGDPLPIDFNTNLYITKNNYSDDTSRWPCDLSYLSIAEFLSLNFKVNGLMSAGVLGYIAGLDFERREQAEDNSWNSKIIPVPDVYFPVERYGPHTPDFKVTIAMLQQRDISLPGLHPYDGSCAWGDANGDGFPDLAVASRQNNGASGNEHFHRLYINNQHGDFHAEYFDLPLSTPSSSMFFSLTKLIWVDMDNDGDLDLVAGHGYGIDILSNDGQGGFTLTQTLPEKNIRAGRLSCGDFDRDGRPDLAVIGDSSSGTYILFQLSPGSFSQYKISSRTTLEVMIVHFSGSAVGDINGDGLLDLVASGRGDVEALNLIWYQNHGDYSFTPRVLPIPGLYCANLAVADCDGDGCDDILYSTGDNGGTRFNGVLKGRPEGMPELAPFQASIPALWGGNVLWADINNDGQLEAVISGIENNGYTNSNNTPKYGSLDRGRPQGLFHNFTRVFYWDETKQQFQDALMDLPGCVATRGPSLLAAADVDRDGDVDLLGGGLFTTRPSFYTIPGPENELCGFYFFNNRSRGYMSKERLNTPPGAPAGLSATALGQGQVRFNWNAAADDSTPAAGLHYVLRVGSSAGKGDICSGAVAEQPQGAISGLSVQMRSLPAQKIYWRVRAIDASGLLSPWSEESSVTVTGSASAPAPQEPLPEIFPPNAVLTLLVADSNNESAGGYVEGPTSAFIGSIVILRAFARPGWRFSHWEGDVLSPLAAKTKMLVKRDTTATARFVPDYDLLKTAATHTVLRDLNGHIWAWSAQYIDARTGPSWLQAADGLPALAAASTQAARWLGTSDSRTYYGVSINGNDKSPDDDHKNFLRNDLVTLHCLDGYKWWNNGTSSEKILDMWFGSESYIANFLVNASEANDINLFGNIATATDTGVFSWRVSEQFTNQVNVGIAHAACTDTFALFLTDQCTIYAFGNNQFGQLGDGWTTDYTTIYEVSGMPRFTAIAAGWDPDSQTGFSLGLDFAGRVWSWGNNDYGQLGMGQHGPGSNELTPQILPPFPSPVVALAAGRKHVLALTKDGRVFAWGDNSQGQVGRGANPDDPLLQYVATPYVIPGLENVICIAAAVSHSLALTGDGALYGWGSNASGQLNGQAGSEVWTPMPVINAPPLSGCLASLTGSLRSDKDLAGTSVAYPGMGSMLPPAGLYAARSGSTLQVEAIDGDRYQFSHWDGPVSEPQNRVTTMLINEGSNQVTAVFTLTDDAIVNMASNPPSAGSTLPLSGEYSFSIPSSQHFVALAAPAYRFTHWDTASDIAGHTQESDFTWTLNGDLNLTACFASRPIFTNAKPNVSGLFQSLTADGEIHQWGVSGYSLNIYTFAGVRLLDLAGNALALGSDGRLYAWGVNRYGERGNGETNTVNYPAYYYNLVLGPDGQAYFNDAIRIFACENARFAQRADKSLYYWGRTVLTEPHYTRPKRFTGLKENAELVDIAGTYSGNTAAPEGSAAFFFLYDDGTVLSWGDAELTGTGQRHDLPMPVTGLSDIRAIAAGGGAVMALSGNGSVFVWGSCNANNYRGTLGLGEEQVCQTTPLQLTSLSNINSIAIVDQSCYAVNQQGKLSVWGDNTAWELGLGADGPACLFIPQMHPAANLPKFTRIAGGAGQITAMTAEGLLWKWGKNAKEYVKTVQQQDEWPVPALDQTFEPTQPHITHQVSFSCDPRAAGLVTWPKGLYTFLDNENISLHADSAPGMSFQAWLRNGVVVSTDPLLNITVQDNFSLQADYHFISPVLALPEAVPADAGSSVALPLFLRTAYGNYEAFDVVVEYPEEITFLGISSTDTQLDEQCVVKHWLLPKASAAPGLKSTRITVRHQEDLFTAGDTPLFKMLFAVPWQATGPYTVSITAPSGLPVFSKQYGAFADIAELALDHTACINISDDLVQDFREGWFFFTPFGGGLPYENTDAWLLGLADQGVMLNPAAWVWDNSQNRWRNSVKFTPNQPMLLYVENSGFARMERADQSFQVTLNKGWTLLAVPEAMPAPNDAVVMFAFTPSYLVLHQQATLQPNTLYWVFKNAEATLYPE